MTQFWKALAIGLPSIFIMVGLAHGVEYFLGDSASASMLLSNLLVPVFIGIPVIAIIQGQHAKLRKARQALEAFQNAAKDQAKLDWMTGLYTHQHFMEHITLGSNSNEGSLIVLDIDHFKRINDRYGHLQGDEALIHVVAAVRKAVRAKDVVGRISGEAFAVFLQDASRAEAKVVASRIRQSVEKIDFKPKAGVKAPLTVSVGVAMRDEVPNVIGAMKLADMRRHKAKVTGRNKVVDTGHEAEVVNIQQGV